MCDNKRGKEAQMSMQLEV